MELWIFNHNHHLINSTSNRFCPFYEAIHHYPLPPSKPSQDALGSRTSNLLWWVLFSGFFHSFIRSRWCVYVFFVLYYIKPEKIQKSLLKTRIQRMMMVLNEGCKAKQILFSTNWLYDDYIVSVVENVWFTFPYILYQPHFSVQYFFFVGYTIF